MLKILAQQQLLSCVTKTAGAEKVEPITVITKGWVLQFFFRITQRSRHLGGAICRLNKNRIDAL